MIPISLRCSMRTAETIWGGSIVEVSLNGTNFVNEHDTGREVQAAQYDGSAQYDNCAGCTGSFGWNPVQGETIRSGQPGADADFDNRFTI